MNRPESLVPYWDMAMELAEEGLYSHWSNMVSDKKHVIATWSIEQLVEEMIHFRDLHHKYGEKNSTTIHNL